MVTLPIIDPYGAAPSSLPRPFADRDGSGDGRKAGTSSTKKRQGRSA
ncbi:MAG: hypothetical protein IPH15_03965 [Comamonadaceae bacterium]|jgi:hypothetical protein|nr:hypothetical protein [Comamonadaceae bacterium]